MSVFIKLFTLIKTKYFWKNCYKLIPEILFVWFFWEGLASTILFLFMIPAIRAEKLSIWLAIIIALGLGWLGVTIFPRSYNDFTDWNPFKGHFGKHKK